MPNPPNSCGGTVMESEKHVDVRNARPAASKDFPAYVYIKNFHYPKGIRMAINFTINFDAQLLRKLKNEPIMEVTRGEFGGRVGIWRLMDLFDRQRIRATLFVPGRICELYPLSLKEAALRGHPLENLTWDKTIPADPEIEREHIRKATSALQEISSRKPVGTRSGHKLSYLKAEGYCYTSSTAVPDDLPGYISDDRGETYMLCLPSHHVLNDAMHFSFGWFGSGNAGNRLADPSKVYDIWLSAFRQSYKMGGYMNFIFHDFDSGRAARIAMLDRLMTEMKRWPGVWFATCEELARYCLDRFPTPPERKQTHP
jgi:peptidoglycan/xylan/chitin deacetylase (PgdA/CDA1 family)